jgi:hypothetical protein
VKALSAPVLRHLHARSKVDLMGHRVGLVPADQGELSVVKPVIKPANGDAAETLWALIELIQEACADALVVLLRRAGAAKEGSGLGVVFAALGSLANNHGGVEWTLLRELPPLVALLEVRARVAPVQLVAIGGGGWRYQVVFPHETAEQVGPRPS